MKKGLVLLMVVLFLASCGSDKAAMKTALSKMTPGTPELIVIKVPNVDRKTVIDEWEDFIEDYKAEVYRAGNEVYADNATIPEVQDGTLDMYAVFSDAEGGAGTNMSVKVDLGGALLSSSSHPEKFKAMQNLLNQFVKQTATNAVQAKYKSTTKALRKLEKKRENLVDENKDLNKDIKKSQQQIEENNKEISRLDEEIKNAKKEAVRLKDEEKKLQ